MLDLVPQLPDVDRPQVAQERLHHLLRNALHRPSSPTWVLRSNGKEDLEVAALASRAPWVAPVARLRCLRGIDTLTAVTVFLEVFDFRRFNTPRPFMRVVGFVPREHSSGGKVARGGITKTGNAYLRRVLVEAAWHAQHRLRPNKAVQARRVGQPPAVVAIAEQVVVRPHRRFARFVARGKRPVIAAKAMARELCGFLWATMVAVPA